jgi:hypothetical protein
VRKNMGNIDRIIRSLVALVVVALYFTGRIHGVLAVVLLVFSAVFLVTSFVSWCPVYQPFGISTRRKADAA